MITTESQEKREILIRKASGEQELFSVEKLERSLVNAGAKKETVSKILSDVGAWIYPGVTTKKIYRRAFSFLKKERTSKAVRYKLKQAILELGPTGYPFEALIGQLFFKQGFSTEVGIIVDGNCVTHEMDVIATNTADQHLVECKYHKDQGKQVSIQVPLYVRSRVNDIIHKRENQPEFHALNFTGWVITNTRFSSESIKYGNCCGLTLLAWDYPAGKGLKELLELHKIYPITILSNLTKKDKRYLLDQGVVTCTQLLDQPDILHTLDFRKVKFAALMHELHDICNIV